MLTFVYIRLQDLEKEELLEQFRALSSEAEKLVTDARVSEVQVNNYKTELSQKLHEDLELKERLRGVQVELEQVCLCCSRCYSEIHNQFPQRFVLHSCRGL